VDGARRPVALGRAPSDRVVTTAPRVLHVAQTAEYGVGRYVDLLLRDQQQRGWPVAFAGPTLDADVEQHRWTATRQPGPGTVGETRALARIVREVQPDVVHLHSSKPGLAGRLLLRGRQPTIFQPHAWSFFAVTGAPRLATTAWERVGARWARVIVCGSEAERAAGEAAGIRARWEVVPNSVDVERFSPADRDEARRALGLPPGERIVVCAARLAVSQKGQDVLLAAWPAVTAAVPEARLVLVGDGPDRDALQRAASARVDFAGEQADTAPWFRAADVVVQPSRYETLSLSVLEALACGRPVVATDAIGMKEAVGDAGEVVPLDDGPALAHALVARLRDPASAADEGARGRARVVARYSLAAWGDRLADLTLAAARS